MKLKLRGHEERYALEQLQLSLFPEEPMEAQFEEFTGNRAESDLFRGKTWLTAQTTITLDDRTVTAARRIPTERETVSLRRRILQQSYYLAAVQLLPKTPAWGALAGVRPTKLSTRSLLSGATEAQTDRELRDTYFVSPLRRQLCLDASRETVKAMERLAPTDISLYIGIPFCPTRCAYCSFVSQTVGAMGNLLEASGANAILARWLQGMELEPGLPLYTAIALLACLFSETAGITISSAMVVPLVITLTRTEGMPLLPSWKMAVMALNGAFLLPTGIRAIPVGCGMAPRYLWQRGLPVFVGRLGIAILFGLLAQ